MKISNLQDAETALRPYVPLVKQLTGKDTTLERIRPLMDLLGNPQDKLRTIHIAGTSGKTSTAYYMSALLGAAGKKVGLTISPHIDSITERVQLNGQPLPEEIFCKELGGFLDIVQQAPKTPSYFELLYAFAIWVFKRHGVDYAVVETGLGGLHDATNVVTRPDKVCIITDIGLDHTSVLGKNIMDIAVQKLGIVHEHNTVIMYRQAREVMSVVERRVKAHHAPLQVVNEKVEQQAYGEDLKQMPAYQQRNWLLAYRTYRYLQKRDSLSNLTSQALKQTQLLQVPARMDIKEINGKTVVMDGAHNAQKMTTFIDSFQQLYPDTKPAILLALKEDKEYQALVPLLSKLASRIIVTTFSSSQDLPIYSMDPAVLSKAFSAYDAELPVTSLANQHQAFEAIIAAPEPLILITGSFYLLAQIRNNEHIL